MLSILDRIRGSSREIETIESKSGKYSIYADDIGGVARRLRAGKGYDPTLLHLFKRQIPRRDGQTIFDIGANIGFFTVQFSRFVGKHGRVIAFEPDPENIRLLRMNCKLNGCENVTIIGKAVSDTVGKATLYLNRRRPSSNSLARDNVPARSTETARVRTTTIDAVSRRLKLSTGYLKIDTQGSEGKILSQATTVLNQPHVLISFEFWPDGLQAVGSDPCMLLDYLRQHGLTLGLSHLAPSSNDEIMASIPERSHTNIIAWKGATSPSDQASPAPP